MTDVARTNGRGGDVLVRGALVAAGDTAPPDHRDVLLDGERIAAVEPAGTIPADAYEVVDATGLVVAPGFVDVHSHADNAPLLDEDDTTKVLQGVTTEVVGNCGFSLAPVVAGHEADLRALASRIFPDLDWGWSSFADLLARLDERGYTTNYVPLVGHGTLRLAVAGMDNRPTTPDERRRMGELLREATDAGAFGLSSGLIYPPAVFSDTAELVELAKHLPEHRLYATHMRNEGERLVESIEEALRIGGEAGRAVQVSHLKAAGEANWGGVPAALERLAAARASGQVVTQDVYPYTASSTMLTTRLPAWFQEGGNDAILAGLDDPTTLDRLRAEAAQSRWDEVLVSSTASHEFEGSTIPEVAAALGCEPFDAFAEVLRRERLRVSAVLFTMTEADLVAGMRDDHTMIGSDGLPPGVGGKPHPRLFGTFPRILGRYVRDQGVLDLGLAVHKMSGLPAATFGLTDRGLVRPGYVADLVAFDADRVSDVGDYRDPVHPPIGIAWVRQAGEVVVRDGAWCGTRRGRRLTPR
ncbi:MAG: amidohydrolase family protein [Streptosporangiales bacterium]|nr:amidohydrolase family protein [Streptosporangiales bacterium]